jgi:hypothetical protein
MEIPFCRCSFGTRLLCQRVYEKFVDFGQTDAVGGIRGGKRCEL